MKKFVCHLLSFVRNVGITLFLAGSAADPESDPIAVITVITVGLVMFALGIIPISLSHKKRYNRKKFSVDQDWQQSLKVAYAWESKRKQWEDNRNFIRNFIIDP